MQDILENGTKLTKEDNTFVQYYLILVGLPSYYLALFSGFITLMLSATRSLALAKPLYIIQRKFINWAFSTCISILLVLYGSTIYFSAHMKQLHQDLKTVGIVENCAVGIMVILVGIFSGISVKTLRASTVVPSDQKIRMKNNRKAAIMIVTLCIVFMICNGAWCIMWNVLNSVIPSGDLKTEYAVAIDLSVILLNIALIAINSSVNPIVYIMRNSALNEYTKTHLMRLWRLIVMNFYLILGYLLR
jgi:hypothetical protein